MTYPDLQPIHDEMTRQDDKFGPGRSHPNH